MEDDEYLDFIVAAFYPYLEQWYYWFVSWTIYIYIYNIFYIAVDKRLVILSILKT